MNNHLKDKVVIVTGAGGGFGRLIAQKAAAQGASVVGVDIYKAGLEETFAGMTACNHQGAWWLADVADRSQMAGMAAFALQTYGRIDILVNNAGTMPLAFFADHHQAADAWERAIDINIKGTLNGITAVYDAMIEQGQGHVVNISSTYGNFPNAGSAVYGASKTAINSLSESLRVESQGKIKVTIVKPTGIPATGLKGSIINPQASIGMLGHHAEQARAVFGQLLAGDLAPEYTDVDSIKYWFMDPGYLADNVLYVMNQPWGVCISDITVRASGEPYML